MKFDIQDTDNNRIIIEANNDVEAINKFFELYPNSSLGTIGILVEDTSEEVIYDQTNI